MEETTNHTKGWFSSKESDVVYVVGLEGSPLLWAPSGNQMINSNKYCSQLDQLKAVLYDSVWNQSTENTSSSMRIMQDHIFLWWPHKNCSAWLGSSDSSTVFTRHCTFRCPFGLYKILLMEKFQFPEKL